MILIKIIFKKVTESWREIIEYTLAINPLRSSNPASIKFLGCSYSVMSIGIKKNIYYMPPNLGMGYWKDYHNFSFLDNIMAISFDKVKVNSFLYIFFNNIIFIAV